MPKLQYYVLTLDDEFLQVVKWIKANKIDFDAHLNRTRFWVNEGEEHTMFLLTWGHVCTPVYDDEDLQTGIRNYGYRDTN